MHWTEPVTVLSLIFLRTLASLLKTMASIFMDISASTQHRLCHEL